MKHLQVKGLKKQRGLSSWGWLLTITAVGFVLTCSFKMGPVYLDNSFVVGALKSLADSESDLKQLSNGVIRSKLNKMFAINNIRGDVTKQVKVVREKNRVLVNIDYETRVKLFYNVDVVMTFNNQLDSSRPGECCTPRN
jgi:Domain of unknown function (DUF4845)